MPIKHNERNQNVPRPSLPATDSFRAQLHRDSWQIRPSGSRRCPGPCHWQGTWPALHGIKARIRIVQRTAKSGTACGSRISPRAFVAAMRTSTLVSLASTRPAPGWRRTRRGVPRLYNTRCEHVGVRIAQTGIEKCGGQRSVAIGKRSYYVHPNQGIAFVLNLLGELSRNRSCSAASAAGKCFDSVWSCSIFCREMGPYLARSAVWSGSCQGSQVAIFSLFAQPEKIADPNSRAQTNSAKASHRE